MVRRWLVSGSGCLLLFDLVDAPVHGLFILDWNGRLTLFEQPVAERFSLAEYGDRAVEALAERHERFSEPIAFALPGDLVLAILELAGEVLRQLACVVDGQLAGIMQDRAVGVGQVLRRLGEASVEVGDEPWQEGIGAVDVADRLQPQLLDQAILQGLVGSLDPALGLGRAGMDRADVECLERT